MREDQEKMIRFIFGEIRKVRKDLDDLYDRKSKLEKLADQFYVSYLNDLWIKAHTQLTEIYDLILEKYGVLKSLEHRLLQTALDEIVSKSITPLEPRE
jgi:hypothetical protein